MPGEIVLINGVSGHVGFRVLVEALANGYKVCAVVRKESQITHIKNVKSIQPYVDNLEFAVVPDFTVPGAFDAHVVGASYIIHVAAPQFSSVDALVDVVEFAATSRAMTKKPSYSVASIFIGTVFGRNELAESTQDLLKGSNLLALASLLGLTFPPTPSLYIHLDDATLSHIRVLTIDIAPGTTRNLVVSYNTVANPDSVHWDEALDVVKKALPGAVASGVFPLDGSLPTLKALVDSMEEERILGSKFKPLERR